MQLCYNPTIRLGLDCAYTLRTSANSLKCVSMKSEGRVT
jgi:hypothetical protein